jgi:hypothetical protein
MLLIAKTLTPLGTAQRVIAILAFIKARVLLERRTILSFLVLWCSSNLTPSWIVLSIDLVLWILFVLGAPILSEDRSLYELLTNDLVVFAVVLVMFVSLIMILKFLRQHLKEFIKNIN